MHAMNPNFGGIMNLVNSPTRAIFAGLKSHTPWMLERYDLLNTGPFIFIRIRSATVCVC